MLCHETRLNILVNDLNSKFDIYYFLKITGTIWIINNYQILIIIKNFDKASWRLLDPYR